MSQRKKFCVVTTQRSGSTWLSRLLDSHPQIKAFEEPFIWREHRPGWKDAYLPTYYDYKTKSASQSPLILFRYLDLLNSYDDGNSYDAIGFKIMYNHVRDYPNILIKFILDNYKIIHLVRKNYLDILISKAVSEQYGMWHSKVDTKTKQIVLEPSTLISQLEKCDRKYQIYHALLKVLPLPVMEITYESLLVDQNRVLCQVADFLQVDSESITFKSDLKRLNKGAYSEKIINYDRVISILKDSKYAHFTVN